MPVARKPSMKEGPEVSAVVGFSSAPAQAQINLFHTKMQVLNSRWLRLLQIGQLFMSLAMIYQMTTYRNQMFHDLSANRAIRLEQANKRYQSAVSLYGEHSREAVIAQRELGLVRNQEAVMQGRIQILQEHQAMMYMGMGISGLTQITQLYSSWGESSTAIAEMRAQNDLKRAAQNATITSMRSAELAGAVATAPAAIAGDIVTAGVGIAPVAEMDIATQAQISAEQAVLSMHAGGVVPTKGFRYLEAGESVNPSKGWDRPQVHTIVMKPMAGQSTWSIAQEFFDRVGRTKGAYN